jgi:hypothetical protein
MDVREMPEEMGVGLVRRERWVIISKKYVGTPENLYWNNNTGWGDVDSADVFTEEEKNISNLPIDGAWLPESCVR